MWTYNFLGGAGSRWHDYALESIQNYKLSDSEENMTQEELDWMKVAGEQGWKAMDKRINAGEDRTEMNKEDDFNKEFTACMMRSNI